MADFQPAFLFMMANEDSTCSGQVTSDMGGRTRFGLAEKYNPFLGYNGFYEMPPADALEMAKGVYERKYWIWGDIKNQSVANYLFDMAVNPGMGAAIKLAQQACSNIGFPCKPDGLIGKQTRDAINSAPSVVLLPELAKLRSDYYVDRAEQYGPSYPLKGLLRRAARIA